MHWLPLQVKVRPNLLQPQRNCFFFEATDWVKVIEQKALSQEIMALKYYYTIIFVLLLLII